MTNIERATQWSQALRSGEYTQVCGYLGLEYENGAEHNCCLGVLARVEGQQRSIAHDQPMLVAKAKVVRYGSSSYSIASSLLTALESYGTDLAHGLKTLCPREADLKFIHPASMFERLNDALGFNFDEIADVIDGFIYGGFINN